jgi:hypothetical protein
MQYKLENEILKSRRGDYQVATLDANPVIWTPEPLNARIPRHRDVMNEVQCAIDYKLDLHKYWENEPIGFVRRYQDLYQQLFRLDWLNDKDARHNIVVNEYCCLTLVQYHNGNLFAYSRSTDMRNGYFSDKLLLNYLAQHINQHRPDYIVEKIVWYMAIPHAYIKTGIARLLENEETTW